MRTEKIVHFLCDIIKDIDQTDLHRSDPAHEPIYGMSTPTNNQATYFSDDKPTSRYIFRDNVTFNIAEIKPVIRRVA